MTLSKGNEHSSLHEAKYPPMTPPAPQLTAGLCLSCIPLEEGEIPCFPSPAEVPSRNSEPQKQWTEAGDSPSAAPRAGLPKLFPDMIPQSWSRTGLGEHRAVGKRGVIPYAPLESQEWLMHRNGAEPEQESGPQCPGQVSLSF